jgi:hypothetical protein
MTGMGQSRLSLSLSIPASLRFRTTDQLAQWAMGDMRLPAGDI